MELSCALPLVALLNYIFNDRFHSFVVIRFKGLKGFIWQEGLLNLALGVHHVAKPDWSLALPLADREFDSARVRGALFKAQSTIGFSLQALLILCKRLLMLSLDNMLLVLFVQDLLALARADFRQLLGRRQAPMCV